MYACLTLIWLGAGYLGAGVRAACMARVILRVRVRVRVRVACMARVF